MGSASAGRANGKAAAPIADQACRELVDQPSYVFEIIAFSSAARYWFAEDVPSFCLVQLSGIDPSLNLMIHILVDWAHWHPTENR